MKAEKFNQLCRVFSKALRANEEQVATVFLRYSGHVDMIDMDIHNGGWLLSKDPDIRKSYDFRYDAPEKLNELEQELDKLLIKELSKKR